MKFYKIYLYTFFVILGTIIGDLIWNFRFNNPLLRKEMLLDMSNGNSGYFLTFTSFAILFLIIIGLLYLYDSGKLKMIVENLKSNSAVKR